VLSLVDFLGKKLMGDLWRTFYLSVQDAIALSLLLKVPSGVSWFILNKSFSTFDICMKESGLGADRYACFIIVASDFMLWVVLSGRIIGRFIEDMKAFIARKSNSSGGPNAPTS
jgi:hypothetical protein